MGKSGWNESSEKSFRICQKNGQTMDKIIWRDRISLGKLALKKFP